MKVLVASIAFLALNGCAMKGATIPNSHIPMAKADYTVMGETTEEACGTYILGIDFPHLFKNEGAAPKIPLLGLALGVGKQEEARALYHALDKIPEATHLLDVRTEAEFHGFGLLNIPIFGQRCAKVHARGVKLGSRPNPQQ